jgi:hypothetical protein
MIALRFYLGRWIVSVDGRDVRSFKTNQAANRFASRLRGDVRKEGQAR